jgi:hypothetical protein
MYTPQPHTMLGNANSNLTGESALIADYRQLSISVQTSNASASRITFIGTNADGLATAYGTPTSQLVPTAGWSIITTITLQGMYVLDTGFRHINCFRPDFSASATSNVTVILQGRV